MRIPRGSNFLRYLLVGLDAVALAVSWTIAGTLAPPSARSGAQAAIWTVLLILLSLTVFHAFGLHRARVCTLRSVEYVRVSRSCLTVAVLALSFASFRGSMARPREIVIGSLFAMLFVTIGRSGFRMWLTNRRRVGRYLRPVVLVGGGAESASLAVLLGEHPELGYRTAAVVGDERDALDCGLGGWWQGTVADLPTVLTDTSATGAIICGSDLCPSELNPILQELLGIGAHVQLSTGLHGVDVGRLRPSPLAYEPFFYVEPVTLAAWQLVAKRVIDFVLASVLLTLTLPLLALAALGIKLQDRGPVLFKQWRVGRDGAPFLLYKLRTIRVGAEDEIDDFIELDVREGPITKIPHDPRVTMFGRVLRATSIDELPQLWNVLNGTMALVGPRPALPDEVIQFDAELRAREAVRPGITGLWQVEGRDNPSFAAYRRFDLFYLENWSVTLDIMILLGTVESVIARVFRGLLHLDEDIAIAPPDVPNPRVREKMSTLGRITATESPALMLEENDSLSVR